MDIIYSPVFDTWNPTGPTDGARYSAFASQLDDKFRVIAPRLITATEMLVCHSAEYVEDILTGWSPGVWDGCNPEQAHAAMMLAGGTIHGLNRIMVGEADVVFNPAGAKHHAQRDRGAGFCAINDMAIAATLAAHHGMRVAYIDIDAHHGDGVENLTRERPNILTASIHSGQIYPGTGTAHEPRKGVYNFPLARGADDADLIKAMQEVCARVEAFDPDIVLYAVGADGHLLDPLSDLHYTLDGFRDATTLVTELRAPYLLAGGAGGYRPRDITPAVWLVAATAMYEKAQATV